MPLFFSTPQKMPKSKTIQPIPVQITIPVPEILKFSEVTPFSIPFLHRILGLSRCFQSLTWINTWSSSCRCNRSACKVTWLRGPQGMVPGFSFKNGWISPSKKRKKPRKTCKKNGFQDFLWQYPKRNNIYNIL